jgi:hypothetical protein
VRPFDPSGCRPLPRTRAVEPRGPRRGTYHRSARGVSLVAQGPEGG